MLNIILEKVHLSMEIEPLQNDISALEEMLGIEMLNFKLHSYKRVFKTLCSEASPYRTAFSAHMRTIKMRIQSVAVVDSPMLWLEQFRPTSFSYAISACYKSTMRTVASNVPYAKRYTIC